jgi:hypothetical protein
MHREAPMKAQAKIQDIWQVEELKLIFTVGPYS